MIQDLSKFQVPAGFRGRPAWFVQAWWLIQATLFAWSPQFMYGWRRWLLRRFGATIGHGVLIRPTVRITYPWKLKVGDWSWIGDDVVLYTLGPITIGAHSVVSQKSYLCTGSHDYQAVAFDIYAKPIIIGSGVWVASDVFVGPGVTLHDGCMVGARSSVYGDLPEQMICLGNPAKPIKPRV